MPFNLIPGQYQISNLILGKGTNVRVSNFDLESYEVSHRDYQLAYAEEKRFGVGQLTPSIITITFNVLKNYIRPNSFNPTGIGNEIFNGMVSVDDLAKAWRFDIGRKIAGELMPLYVCGQDGITRVIYGRPGKFKYDRRPHDFAGWIDCTAEFIRADTLVYRADEYVVPMTMQENPQWLTRLQGNCDSWFRILAEGPMENPVFTVGDNQIGMNYTIPAGETVEISSYPHKRRCVNNKRINLADTLVGKTRYLDRLVIPSNISIPVRWTSDEINTFVPALGNISWAEDIRDLNNFNLPNTFTPIAGRVVVRFDLFNVDRPKKYLASGIFGTTCAAIYNESQYNTQDQYLQAKIVEPFWGRSALVMMSNIGMTNFIMLEVTSGPGNNYLKIRTGSSYNTYSAVRAQWQNTDFWGWAETDIVAIGFDPGTNTFTAYFNGNPVATWIDSGIVVNRSNNRAGVIFDLDGGLLSEGVGFADFLGYDRATVPAPTGSAVLLWQDSWATAA